MGMLLCLTVPGSLMTAAGSPAWAAAVSAQVMTPEEGQARREWDLDGGQASWDLSREEERLLEEEILREGLEDEGVQEDLEEYLEQLDMGSGLWEGGVSDKVRDPALTMIWDGEGRFCYTLPNGSSFVSSVPRGMITSEAVDLELPEGTAGIIRRDDAVLASPESWHFTEKGNYHVRLLMFGSQGEETRDYNLYEVNFYFTIIQKTDNTLGAVPSPDGFAIKKVTLDGKEQPFSNRRCFFLGEDGQYEILYESEDREGVFASTEFVRDTTAPFLTFSPEPEDGKSSGPVEFFPSQPDCRVFMNYNGNRGYAVGNVLTAAGNYELSVEDQAGNRRVYHVGIRQTYRLGDKRMAGLLLILAICGVARLLFLRWDMNVL